MTEFRNDIISLYLVVFNGNFSLFKHLVEWI